MAGSIIEARTASERAAKFIVDFSLEEAPKELIGVAETAFLDTLGVMLAGSQEPAARIVCDMVATESAEGRAMVVGRALRTSPQNAALANGTANQALDFDFSYMIGQSAAAVIPGLLPLAETTGARPAELIAAFVVGAEVCARLARAMPTLSSEGRWHASGVLSTLGAAAACARMSGVPVEKIPNVIGISASMASGITANFGTMTKPLHPGLAARNGMMAAYLGADGFTASPTAIEGNSGFMPLYGRGLQWDMAPFDDLGETFNLLDPGYKIKPFSCGGLAHTAIEATLQLREETLPRVDEISRITVGTTQHTMQRVIDRYPWSEDSSRFSFKYLIPYTIIHGAPTLAAFKEEALDDAAVRGLSGRVESVLDDEFKDLRGSGYSPNRVTIEFENGDKLEHAVYHPSGSKEAPMSDDRIKEKFMACATQALDEGRAGELYDYLRNFHAHADLKDLWPLISGED